MKRLNEHRTLIMAPGTTLDKPGIYAWEIEGIGVYVGRFTRKRRPMGSYDSRVRKLLAGKDYRPGKPKFRHVHYALAEGLKCVRKITLTIVANAAPGDDLNQLERQYIRTHATGGLNRT